MWWKNLGRLSETFSRINIHNPKFKPPHPDALLSTDIVDSDFYPVLFDIITAEAIRKSALLTEGSAGPSGMDAFCWRRLYTAFGEKSNELCSAIAAFAKRICSIYVDPSSLMAYTLCRLVPLDKCLPICSIYVDPSSLMAYTSCRLVPLDKCPLPVRLGSLGLQNPINMSREQHRASKLICAPLVDRIVNQDHHLGECSAVQQGTKARLRSRKRNQQKEEAKNLQNQLSSSLQRSMELSQEKGASAWLTSLPIDDHGFALHKSAFRDALSLRYGWSLHTVLVAIHSALNTH